MSRPVESLLRYKFIRDRVVTGTVQVMVWLDGSRLTRRNSAMSYSPLSRQDFVLAVTIIAIDAISSHSGRQKPDVLDCYEVLTTRACTCQVSDNSNNNHDIAFVCSRH